MSDVGYVEPDDRYKYTVFYETVFVFLGYFLYLQCKITNGKHYGNLLKS